MCTRGKRWLATKTLVCKRSDSKDGLMMKCGGNAVGAMVDRPYLLTSDPPPPPPIEVRVAPIERPIYYSGPPTQETGIGSLQPLLGLKNEIRTEVNRAPILVTIYLTLLN